MTFPPFFHTPIKVCGLTREEDVDACAQAGVNAIGFVFYEKSPRFISPERAHGLANRLPAFITPVLLFVNASEDDIRQACDAVPSAWLQFHGDESPAFCDKMAKLTGRRYIRALRMPLETREDWDKNTPQIPCELVEYSHQYQTAHAILLDAFVPGYGGGGKTFNWSLIPQNVNAHLVLSGGLTPANVGDAIHTLKTRGRSFSVDVSSGVEASKGIKDAQLIHQFVQAVRQAEHTSR